jgi:cytochrome c biogenesis factor
MSPRNGLPILLCVLVGAVLGLVVWGLQRSRSQAAGDSAMGTRGDLLLGLIVLAAFALGVFLTYVLIGFNF